MSDEKKLDLDDATFIAPDIEPRLPSGVDRLKAIRAAVAGSPRDTLMTTTLVLYDLLELLIKHEVIKLSDLEQIKKDAWAEILASNIVVRGS